MGKLLISLSLFVLTLGKIIDSESDHIEKIIMFSHYMVLPMELIVLFVILTG